MSAEYSGKMDEDKTVPILPRPLKKVQHRIRALNLTGDASGIRSTDRGLFWQGLDRDKAAVQDAQLAARLELEKAIDEAWY